MGPENQAPAFDQVTREKVKAAECDIETLWQQVEKLRDRLPVWVTFLIAVMSAVIGVCANHFWSS